MYDVHFLLVVSGLLYVHANYTQQMIGHYQDPMGDNVFMYHLKNGQESSQRRSMRHHHQSSSGSLSKTPSTLDVQKRMKVLEGRLSQWQVRNTAAV